MPTPTRRRIDGFSITLTCRGQEPTKVTANEKLLRTTHLLVQVTQIDADGDEPRVDLWKFLSADKHKKKRCKREEEPLPLQHKHQIKLWS